jgi:hypothetical protein
VGELDLEREKDLSTQREREEFSLSDGNLHRLPTVYSGSSAQQRRERRSFMVERLWGERESGEEANGRQGRFLERLFELYTPG